MHMPQNHCIADMCKNKESIRASRLSNREVMLSSTALLHNMNLPSSSSSASIDYLVRNRKPCTSNRSEQSMASDQSNGMVKAKPSTTSTSTSASNKSSAADDTEADTNSSSNINDNDNDSNDQDNTDLSLSQYELDIVNKYLNEMSSSNDESNDYDKNISESNHNENQLTSIESSSMNSHRSSLDGGDSGSGHHNTQSNRSNVNDQCTTADVSIESDGESPTQSQTQTQSQSQSQSHDASTSAMQQLLPVSSASNEIRACIQTSRQIVFDRTNQIDAMINPTRYTDYLGHTHNDVNNNNLSLSSNNTNTNTNTNNHTDHSYSSNHGRHYSSERNYGMTADRTSPTGNRFTISNLPIIVGITSCVWGLFFYAVKCLFFSDLT